MLGNLSVIVILVILNHVVFRMSKMRAPAKQACSVMNESDRYSRGFYSTSGLTSFNQLIDQSRARILKIGIILNTCTC